MSKPKYTTKSTDDAIAKYQQQLQKYDNRMNEYNQLKNKYAGDAGYNRATKLAQDNAISEAQNQQALAMAAAQQQGMTRAQAAGMAANAVNSGYNSALNNWYDRAYQTGTDYMNSDLNGLNAQGQQVNNYAQLYNMGQGRDNLKNQIADKKRSNTLGNIGLGVGTVGGAVNTIGNIISDEKTKNKLKWGDLKWCGKISQK